MKKKELIKKSAFLIVLFSGVFISLQGIIQIDLPLSNHDLVSYLVEESNSYIDTDFNLVKKMTSFLSGFDLDNPITILERNFVARKDTLNDLMYQTSYIADPKYTKVNKPVIYIYNTRQLEAYADKNNLLKPNVMMATYSLRDELEKLDISAYVETTDLTNNLIKSNNLYDETSKIIRPVISDTLTKYPNLRLIIDLGRDIANYSVTTLKKSNSNYSKFLFIVNSKYTQNITLAQKLSDKLNSVESNLSRGLVYKNDYSITNLDLSDNMLIIKCGGVDNSIEEVKRSLTILAQVINSYLGETYGEI